MLLEGSATHSQSVLVAAHPLTLPWAAPIHSRIDVGSSLPSDAESQQTMTQQLPIPAAFAPPTREQWLALVEKDLKGAPFEKRLVTQLIEGLTVQPLYTSAEAPDPHAMGLPGQAPFARGSMPMQGAHTTWAIMPEHRHPIPSEANRAILADVLHGADGVVVRLSPRLLGEDTGCGGCSCGGGVLVDSVEDLDQLFADVDHTKILLTLAAGPAFLPAASLLLAHYARRGIAPTLPQLQFGADPLGTLAARGALPRTAEAAIGEMASLAALACARLPKARAVTVSTAPYDNAGATAAQELAAATATGLSYLRAMESAGLTVAQAARQLVFSLSVGTDQFLEIAKFRAMRVIWNRVLEAASVPEQDRSILLHARTSRRVLTQRDPWVNVLRTTIGCFGAAVGGADRITVLPFDDVIGPHDALAQRLARNTQIILHDEGNLGRVLDAAGGSYYIEHLTLALAQGAYAQFQAIERRGGMLAVLRDGSFAKEIDAVWEKRSKDLARRKTPITGVSEYPHLGEKPVERAKVDVSGFEASLLKRRELRQVDAKISALTATLTQLQGVPQCDAAVAAAAGGATLFALQNALGKSGESVQAFHLRRFSAGFEKLRDQSDQRLAQEGRRPRIFSANMGPIATHTARAMFAQNFFEAGGVEVMGNDGFLDVPTAVDAFAASGAAMVVICSSDAWYEASVAELATALKQRGAQCVVLAGNPGPNETKYREAGIDQFIFIGCDVLGTLTKLAQNQKVAS